jgi:hypothetical protein
MVHTSRSLALLAGLVVFGGVAVAPVMAGTVIYNFSGDVDHVGTRLNPSPLPFSTTSSMSGSMTVNTQDLRNPPPPSDANRGSYNIESFNVQIGDYTATLGPGSSGLVEIRNLPGGDRFEISVSNLIPVGSVPSLPPNRFEFELRGLNTIFSNDQLPAPGTVPSIGTFGIDREWRLLFGSGGDTRRINGGLEAITAVPLPAGVILFGVGLVALIGLGAGGLRNFRESQA